MTVRRATRPLVFVLALGLLVFSGAPALFGQNPSLTVLSRDGRRTLPLAIAGDQEFVALDDLANLFQLTVREESGALTVTDKGRTIVLTPDQAIASISGRLVSLPARPTRAGGRWQVPLEFISRALASVHDVRLDLRRPSRLLVVGDLRVPRLTVRHEPLGNAARLTIDATPRTTNTVQQENDRLTIKFDADALDVTLPQIQSQGFVLGLRMPDPLTIAVDLGPRFSAFRASSEAIDNTTRLVIDFVGAPTDSTTTAPPAAAPPPDLPSLSQPRVPLRTIAIDAGHGGDEIGARGPKGATEKDVTLSLAKRLRAALESRLGVRVVMTRDDDRQLTVDERAAVANNNKADLFLSLHANASFRPATKGATIFVAAFSAADAAEVKLVPERLPTVAGGTRDIELVPWDRAQMRHVQQSLEAARILEGLFQGHVPMAATPIDRAGLRVLESANMPALLIEAGYLTNPEQERLLTNGEFHTTFAEAVVEAIVKFRDYLSETDR